RDEAGLADRRHTGEARLAGQRPRRQQTPHVEDFAVVIGAQTQPLNRSGATQRTGESGSRRRARRPLGVAGLAEQGPGIGALAVGRLAERGLGVRPLAVGRAEHGLGARAFAVSHIADRRLGALAVDALANAGLRRAGLGRDALAVDGIGQRCARRPLGVGALAGDILARRVVGRDRGLLPVLLLAGEEIGQSLFLLLGFLLGLLLLEEFEQMGRILKLRRRLAGTVHSNGRNRKREHGRHGPVTSLGVPRPTQWYGSRPNTSRYKARLCRLCV